MKILKDINYSSKMLKECTLDAYLPDEVGCPIFIYIHGGGLVEGDKGKDGHRLSSYLVSRGIGVVSLNYRMYPNASYPDFIEDCTEGIKWVFDNLRDSNNNIFVGGSSAGAYISMMLCFNTEFLTSHGIHPSDISAYVHDAGQPTAHFNVLAEQGIDSRRIIVDNTAPLYYVGLEEKYPPMLFMWSDNDMPGRHEQLKLTLSTIKAFGYDMSQVESIIRPGTHVHYLHSHDDPDSFEFSSLIYPFLEKYSKN